MIDPTTREAIADPDIFSQSRFLHYMLINFIQKKEEMTDFGQALIYFENLRTEDRAYFFKKFGKESGSIVAQASWSDEVAIQKMLEPFNTRQ